MKASPLFILLLLSVTAKGQGTWLQEANYGGGIREGATGFAIGSKGYFATGMDANIKHNDLWEFDPSTNVWSQMANLPSNPRIGAVSFSIGLKGYVGLGKDIVQLNDFWEYDPSLNNWTPIANFTGASRCNSVGFSIGNNGFVGTGRDETTYTMYNDFWKYNQISNTWIQLPNFPGTTRKGASGFAIGGNGYIGLGYDIITPYPSDFWKFDTTLNSWTAVANFPGPIREGAIGFCIGNEGYVSSGGSPFYPYNYYTDLWKYDPSFDFWNSLASYPAPGRMYSAGFNIDSCLYIGTGCWSGFDPPTYYENDFWTYCTNTITSVQENPEVNLTIFPNPFSTQSTLKINGNFKNMTVTVYNSFGQQVNQMKNISGQTISLSRDNLPNGLYFIRLTKDNIIIETEKFVLTD